jgi:trimeric autotransporter adhesin
MSKLIGTNPNQVPSNADLGTAAFMDSKDFLTSRGSSLSAIDSIIPKTATSVFVYDTSKDSDAGAWRKRTQGTSWYNETLNTATRGSRREFPSVAILVTESDKLTIYDADDTNVEMWMVFERGYGSWPAITGIYVNGSGGTNTASSIKMMNATLVGGSTDSTTDNAYSIVLNFISEKFTTHGNASYKFTNTISERNSLLSGIRQFSTPKLVGNIVYDVAMTVLSDAPIDNTTGLPTPTIAFATDEGVTVFKDDGNHMEDSGSGSHFDIYGSNWAATSQQVTFGDDKKLYFSTGSFAMASCDVRGLNADITNIQDQRASYKVSLDDYPIKQITGNDYAIYGWTEHSPAWKEGEGTTVVTGLNSYNPKPRLVRYHMPDNIGYGTYSGDKQLYNHVSHDYNTGWMHGDIRLATLSSTVPGKLSSNNLVTNGNFSNGTTGWTATNSTLSVSGGELTVTSTGGNRPQANQTISTVIGKTYLITANGRRGTATSNVEIEISGISSKDTASTDSNSVQTLFNTFIATATSHIIQLKIDDGNVPVGETAIFDNVTMTESIDNRHATSQKGGSLRVFGNITKTEVAPGAELMAFGGFDASGTANNYLEYNYSEDLEFGTGDFSVTGWFKTSDQSYVKNIVSRYTIISGGTAQGMNVSIMTDGTLYLYTKGSPSAAAYTPTNGQRAVDDNRWHHFVASRFSTGFMEVWVDGELYTKSYMSIQDVNVASQARELRIAYHYGSDQSACDNLALIRMSASVPTEYQVKKMYEEERGLFQKDAKATLQDTDNQVIRDVAYDSHTGLHYVVTDQGKSVFKGLNRVDQSDKGVNTAISVHKGLTVEE